MSIMDGRFFIVNIQDLNYSLKKLRYLLIMICLVGALVWDICFLIVYYISKDTDRSVKKILNAMNEANKGNLDSKVEIEGSDEFAKISGHFNEMLTEIKKSSEQERESMVREKNAEIRSLEAQINPHFLYNTLDSITWMIEDGRNDEAAFMISQLAKLFRISLSKGHTVINIRDELQHARSYMNIQKIRYKNAFSVTFDVDDSLYAFCIVKLVLQPILENAINYGNQWDR